MKNKGMWMVYFKNKKILEDAFKNSRAREYKPPLRSGLVNKSKGRPSIIQTGKKYEKADQAEFAKKLGPYYSLDISSIKGNTETEIIFESNISFGGMKEGRVFFVNEKDEEVAFFYLKDIKEIVQINKQ